MKNNANNYDHVPCSYHDNINNAEKPRQRNSCKPSKDCWYGYEAVHTIISSA